MKLVSIIMGSISDKDIMSKAFDVLDEFAIPYEKNVISAHRALDELIEYTRSASDRGVKVFIAGAGGAAHLPGVIAANTILPVIGVPIQSKSLNGLDSLLSIVQMPSGVPVATVAINGSHNAALLAIQILGLYNLEIEEKLKNYKLELKQTSLKSNENL